MHYQTRLFTQSIRKLKLKVLNKLFINHSFSLDTSCRFAGLKLNE
jgi:hypothetical protein